MKLGISNAKQTHLVVLGLTNKHALVIGITLALLLIACTSSGLLEDEQCIARECLQVTATAEAMLTKTYGPEVSEVIENFELHWHSLQVYIDPKLESEVAVNPFLTYWGLARFGEAIYDWPSWSIITSAEVSKVRVLEYSPERFKAVALVGRKFKDITPEGIVLEASRSEGTCGVYVFVRKDDVWKLHGFFLTMGHPDDVTRDWHNTHGRLKEVIGELPDYKDVCPW